VDDRLAFDRASHVMATDLLGDFNEWLSDRGHRGWSDKTFAARFGEHDEVTNHRVAKQKVRDSKQLSRPSSTASSFGVRSVPRQYAAWLGVRFATDPDLDSDQGEQGALGGDCDGCDGRSGELKSSPRMGFYRGPVTPVTRPRQAEVSGVPGGPRSRVGSTGQRDSRGVLDRGMT
jgi:hypothetical protein